MAPFLLAQTKKRAPSSSTKKSCLKRKYDEYEEEASDCLKSHLPMSSVMDLQSQHPMMRTNFEDMCCAPSTYNYLDDFMDSSIYENHHKKTKTQDNNTYGSELTFGSPLSSPLEYLKSNYQRFEQLEESETGITYKATRRDNKFCTVNVIKSCDATRDMFLLSTLKNSHLVEITNSGVINQHAFVEMKWYKDGTLLNLIKKAEYISEKNLIAILYGLLDAVLYLKQNNITCTDIKPQSVMIEKRQGDIKVFLNLDACTYHFSPEVTNLNMNLTCLGNLLYMLTLRTKTVPNIIYREDLIENISGNYSEAYQDLLLLLLHTDQVSLVDVFQIISDMHHKQLHLPTLPTFSLWLQ